MLKFTDSLTSKKIEFSPRTPGKVSVYWCGPTVYDAPHLGHARSTMAFDVLVRYLRWSGYEVSAVSNITDIDDKIIARAAKEGTTEPDLASRFEKIFIAEMDRLNIAHPNIRPRATEFVDKMISVISDLIKKNMAYTTKDGVYFDVDKLDEYGALVHRGVEDLREGAGARVDVDDSKNDPLDFALWKAAKPGEPTWDSPWGPGRPGWHIECVAMSLDLLGDGFDIHGGGDDLIFPHHENERAEALGCGREFARYWIHNGMVQVDGEKMSKSLGNFTTLEAMLDHWDPRALRLLILQTHYRQTMEIGTDSLDGALIALDRLDVFADRFKANELKNLPPNSETIEKFNKAMDDDLGTPAATAVIFDAVRETNRHLDERNEEKASELGAAVGVLTNVLGLNIGRDQKPTQTDKSDIEKTEIEKLINERNEARNNGDYKRADEIRDDFIKRGIILEDSKLGTSWHRS